MIKVLIFLFVLSCARAPLENSEDSMRLVKNPDLTFIDQLSKEGLIKGIKLSIEGLEKRSLEEVQFGEVKVSKNKYIDSLNQFLSFIDQTWEDKEALKRQVFSHFDLYEVYGHDNYGEVLMTGYYTPVVEVSSKKTKEHPHAIFKKPDNHVIIKLHEYEKAYSETSFRMDGRKIYSLRGMNDNGIIRPYYTREEIVSGNRLANKNLEIAFADPVEAFFLQIQGNAKIIFDDGSSTYLNYHEQNGHKYFAIGKALTDHIPLEEMSMGKIKDHLRSVSEEERERILNLNKSFIFFKKRDSKPTTFFNTEVIAGRTMATDDRYFPKGTLAYLKMNDNPENSRFVVDHDRGGGIRGGGRIDLYIGEGEEAERAGKLKQLGRLYYLVPKSI